MAKKYKLFDEKSYKVRRPLGERQFNKKSYKDSEGKILSIYTAPRRPNYKSYGKITLSNKTIYEGEKNETENKFKELNKMKYIEIKQGSGYTRLELE